MSTTHESLSGTSRRAYLGGVTYSADTFLVLSTDDVEPVLHGSEFWALVPQVDVEHRDYPLGLSRRRFAVMGTSEEAVQEAFRQALTELEEKHRVWAQSASGRKHVSVDLASTVGVHPYDGDDLG